jgi:hypothetical protein
MMDSSAVDDSFNISFIIRKEEEEGDGYSMPDSSSEDIFGYQVPV